MRGIRLATIAISPLSLLARRSPADFDALPDRSVAYLPRPSTSSAATSIAQRIINLKTGTTLGVTIPQSILIQGDEVIR